MSDSSLVVGRIVIEKGEAYLEPIHGGEEHKKTVMAYQDRVQALIEAARVYRAKPTAENLVALSDAANELD